MALTSNHLYRPTSRPNTNKSCKLYPQLLALLCRNMHMVFLLFKISRIAPSLRMWHYKSRDLGCKTGISEKGWKKVLDRQILEHLSQAVITFWLIENSLLKILFSLHRPQKNTISDETFFLEGGGLWGHTP